MLSYIKNLYRYILYRITYRYKEDEYLKEVVLETEPTDLSVISEEEEKCII